MTKSSPYIFVITGAESTGKSMLTEQLAYHFNVPFYSEFARDYILRLGRKYNISDIEIIAKKQVEQYNEARNSDHKIIFFDTWLIITKVWYEKVYNISPEWILRTIKEAKIDGFILNDIDIPWEPDLVRENGGESRKMLHEIYVKNLQEFRLDYFLNQGMGESRLNNPINYVETKIRNK